MKKISIKYIKFPEKIFIKYGLFESEAYILYASKSKIYKEINDDGVELLTLLCSEKTVEEIFKELELSEKEKNNYRDFIESLIKLGVVEGSKNNNSIKNKNQLVVKSNKSSTLDLVGFVITERCNLNCSFCYQKVKNTSMDIEIFDKCIDQLKTMDVFSAIVTGGEPLIHPEFGYFIERLHDLYMPYNLQTNCLLFDDDKLEQIEKYPPEAICTSVDLLSNSTKTNAHTNPKIISRIKELIQIGLLVNVNITIADGVNSDINELHHLYSFLLEIGVHRINIGNIVPVGNASMNMFLKSIGLAPLIFDMVGSKSIVDNYNSLYNTSLVNYNAPSSICGFGTYMATIYPNGDVVPCMVLKDLIAGNVLEKDIRDIWTESPLLKNIRDDKELHSETCKKCDSFFVCKGGYKAKTYQLFGRFDEIEPWSCSLFGKDVSSTTNRLSGRGNN